MSGSRYSRNDLLRHARLRTPSPSRPDKPMSRQELADAVNQWLLAETGQPSGMDVARLGTYEVGEHRWPRESYRRALRTVLGVGSDAELGFCPRRLAAARLGWLPPLTRAFDLDGIEAVSCGPLVAGAAGERLRRELARMAHLIGGDDPAIGVGEWEGIVVEYATGWGVRAPQEILRDLVVDVPHARDRLGLAVADEEQLVMLRVAARLGALVAQAVGELGDGRTSRRWWHTATCLADACDASDLRAWVRGREIIHGLADRRPMPVLLALANQTQQRIGDAPDPGPGAAWLLAARARLLAVADRGAESAEVLRQLRTMTDQLAACDDGDLWSMLGWSPVRLHHTETVVYALLGDARRADAARGRALALYPEDHGRDRAELGLYQALGLVQQHDAVSGASLARRILANLPVPQRSATVREAGRRVLDAIPKADSRRPEVSGLRDLVSPPGA
ncbi:MAG: hypothetical protein HKP61_15715 [Dactylosporangium sp.]|nr:hypothetical protein [Dactylosporangium sp.]NNJ62353.1 hypothetical protein [Dactylosporangium sp.]